MKHLLIFTLLFGSICIGAYSCRTPQRLIEIAKERGAVIESDTVTEIRIDTVFNELGEILRIDTVTNTIEVQKIVSVPMTRQERLALKDEYKHLEKMYKLRIDELEDSLRFSNKNLKTISDMYSDSLKTERVKARQQPKRADNGKKNSLFWSFIGRKWWILLIVGFVIRHFMPIIWKFIKGYFGFKPKN